MAIKQQDIDKATTEQLCKRVKLENVYDVLDRVRILVEIVNRQADEIAELSNRIAKFEPPQ